MRKTILIILLLCLGALPVWGITPALSQEEYCAQPHQDVSTPLNDLGNNVYIRLGGYDTGFTGGLYPSGSNVRPAEHEAAGVRIAAQVIPRDENGDLDPLNGRIVLLSIGVSNTFTEFDAFSRLVNTDPEINPKVQLVNGAQHSRTSDWWIDPNSVTWQEVFRRLADRGVTPQQVQIAWIKHTRLGHDYFPGSAQTLQSDLEAISRNLKTHFPNIKIAYLSSRTRSYYIFDSLALEPHAFETGFAVKWLIEKQMDGDLALNYDPERGEVVAPYLAWGAYLWIDGMNPRSDGRIWTQQDLYIDCIHPTQSGAAKVADMLMEFFKNDSTAMPWFLAGGSSAPPTQIFLPTVTNTLPAPTAAQTRSSPTQMQTEEPALAPTEAAYPAPAICGLSGALTAMLFTWLGYRKRC